MGQEPRSICEQEVSFAHRQRPLPRFQRTIFRGGGPASNPPPAAEDAIQQLHYLIEAAGPYSDHRKATHKLLIFLHGIQPHAEPESESALHLLLNQHEASKMERKLPALVPKVMRNSATLEQSLRLYAQRIAAVKRIVPVSWETHRSEILIREEQLSNYHKRLQRYEFSSLLTILKGEVDALTFREEHDELDIIPGLKRKKRKVGDRIPPAPKPDKKTHPSA